jgi:hypothetical protein
MRPIAPRQTDTLVSGAEHPLVSTDTFVQSAIRIRSALIAPRKGMQKGNRMDNLLSAVLDAHGGLTNWASTRRMTALLSLGGPFWAARGWPDLYSGSTVTLDPHREHITFAPFGDKGRLSLLEVAPERVTISLTDGQVIEHRVDPRKSFPADFSPADTPWDAVQVAYFTSAAVWNYLTAPFVFTYPGVEAQEIESWVEGSQTWRRLAVTFPASIANHNARQVFYYDENFMQRRMDYSPVVTGSPPVAHYTSDHKVFDGFLFPTRRRVHLHDEHGIADQQFAPITIDVDSVRIERA